LKYKNNKRKSFDIRLYAGQFLINSDDVFGSYPFSLISQGSTDFYDDNFYFGRNSREGLAANQISLDQGGFKFPINAGASSIGLSNDFMLAMNIKADLPNKFLFNLPIKPYADLGYFQSISGDYKFYYNTGLAIDLFDGMLGVYFPLFLTDEVKIQQPDFASRISFNLNLNKLNGFEALRNLSIN